MIDVQRINREIQKELQQGKSLFQIAIGMEDETRLAILDYRAPEIVPYARVAAWFSDFFENSDGQDYLKSGGLEGQRKTANECWRKVFPEIELNNENFKSQCWLLDNKEKGRSSHLWAGLKQCLDLPRDSRFSIAAYDAPPKYLALLLNAYQRGESSGTDFAEFIETFENGVNPGTWHDRLYRACQEKFSDRANLGVYLQWSGGVSGGIGVGVDRLRGSCSSALYFDGRKIDTPSRNKFYPVPNGDIPIKVAFRGNKTFVVDPSPVGIYYRYVSDDGDPRHSWWKRVPSKDGVIPFSRDELLVCLKGDEFKVVSGVYDAAKLFVGEPFDFSYHKGHEEGRCRAIRITVEERPAKDVVIEIADGLCVKLAGRIPQIEILQGLSQELSAGDVAVCSGNCRIGMEDLDEELTCSWQMNDEDPDNAREVSLSAANLGDDLHHIKVVCRVFNANCKRIATLVRHLVWMPEHVAQKLVTCRDVRSPGWKIKLSEESDEVIRDRIRNRVRYYLEGPGGQREHVYARANGMSFWFAHGLEDWEVGVEPNQAKQFWSKSEAEDWYLCVPGNISSIDLKIDNSHIENPEHEPINGVWRIELDKLIGHTNSYVYDQNVRLQSLTCNDVPVVSFGDAPKSAFLCQDQNRKWGVYIPPSDRGKYKVVLYTDNTKDQHFMTPLVEHGLHAEKEPFHPLDNWVSTQISEDAVGELYLALMPDADEYQEQLILGHFLHPPCQVRVLRKKSESYADGQNLGLLKVIQSALTVPSGHVFAKSRLMVFSEPVPAEELASNWKTFAESGCVERLPEVLECMLKSDYNFLADARWYFGALKQLEAGVMCARGQQRVSRRVREAVRNVLLDNGDDEKGRMMRGVGCCPAIVAQAKLDTFEKLVKDDDEFKQREVTRLNSPNRTFNKLALFARVRRCDVESEITPIERFRRASLGTSDASCGEGLDELELDIEKAEGDEIWLGQTYFIKRDLPFSREISRVTSKVEDIWLIQRNCSGVSGRSPYKLKGFCLRDPKKYIRNNYGDFADSDALTCLNLTEEDGVSLASLGVLQNAFRDDSRRLRNGVGRVLSAVVDAVHEQLGWRDEFVVILAGLSVAVSLTLCRDHRPRDWKLAPDGEAGRCLLQLVRLFFLKKFHDGNPIYWRKLMREIVCDMHLLSYLNADII